MYTSFYNLHCKPFGTLPDPVFIWLGAKHTEALTALRCGLFENEGLLLLSGGAGTGKTTLINVLTQKLGKDVDWAVISDPSLARLDFYNAITKGFKLEKECTSKVQFLIQFSSFLHKAHDENKKVLLLVDDCHRLSQDMLEELRLLSNIKKAENQLINIFFVGRIEFDDMLAQPKNRAVRQRLTIRIELTPLTGNETDSYIRHRLHIAGMEEKLFTAKAIQLIYSASKGNPRLINSICDQAMTAGFLQGNRTLDHKALEECVQKSNLRVSPILHESDERTAAGAPESEVPFSGANPRSDVRWVWGKYALAVILVVAAGIYFYFPPEKTREAAVKPIAQQPAEKEIGQVIFPPVVGLPEQNELAIDVKNAAVIQQAFPKAYNTADEKDQEEATVQTENLEAVQTKAAGEAPSSLADTEADFVPDAKLAEQKRAGAGSGRESGEEKTVPVLQRKIFAGPGTVVKASQGNLKLVATMQKVFPGEKEAGRIAPMEPNKVVLGLRPDSLELTSEAAGDYKKFVAKLKDYPQAQVLVKGFVSAKANSPENVRLSEERAMAVQKLLVASGIEPARIEIRGLGNLEPVASNTTSEGRAKNRRVEIIVVNDGR